MNTLGQECIWKNQCGAECTDDCDYFTPADDLENIGGIYYFDVLKQNAEEYQHMIDDYSDGKVNEYES